MTRPRLASVGDALTRWVLLLGLLGALPLVILTPAFEVADEPQHFQRAYQISQLDLFGHPGGRGAGAILPVSLSALVQDVVGTTALEADRSIKPRPLAEDLKALARPLEPDRVRFTDFTGAAPYSPLSYVPQAIGIAFGRALGMGPLALLYIARLANALAAILLLAMAVRIAPIAREALAFTGLLPMALYQYASSSPDALTIASMLLFVAVALRAVVSGWTTPTIAAAGLLGAVLCSHKPVYAPILMLALVPPIFRPGERVRALVANGLVVAVALGITAAWFALNHEIPLTRRPDVNVPAQLGLFADRPWTLPILLWNDIHKSGIYYLGQLVGVIGWNKMPLPRASYAIPVLAMGLIVLLRRPSDPLLPRIAGFWQVALAIAGAVLVEIALYLTWTPVGAPLIDGVQGRYFLPLMGTLLVGANIALRAPANARRARVLCVAVLALIAAQIVILQSTVSTAYSRFSTYSTR